MPKETPTHGQLLSLLERAVQSAAPDEVVERLRWFTHFAKYHSISKTCSEFGIARTTFYRWYKRLDLEDLSTLQNTPKSALVTRVRARDVAPCIGCPLCYLIRRLSSWSKSPALAIALLLVTLLNITLLLFSIPQTAKASGWSAKILTNTEGFQTLDDSDAAVDIQLKFGDTINKSLIYERSAAQFKFDDDLSVQGFFNASGIDGAGLTDCDDSSSSKLLWDASTKTFSCGTDQNSGGPGTTTLQDAYDNDSDVGDAMITLTADDDSVLIKNPASGGTDSNHMMIIQQLSNGKALLLQTDSTTNPAFEIDTQTEGDNADSAPHISFGYAGAFDTNLFRDAANTLRTGGHFIIDEDLTVKGNVTVDQDLTVTGGLDGAGLADCDNPGDKLLWDDTLKQFTCGTDETASASADLKPYMVIDTTGNQTITNTEMTVNLDSESISNANYTLANDEITISEAGTYQVSYSVLYDITNNSGGNRGRVTSFIEDNDSGSFAVTPGSYASVYHRESAGGSGMSATFILVLSNANSEIRLRTHRTYGSTNLDTIANQTSLSIIKLE